MGLRCFEARLTEIRRMAGLDLFPAMRLKEAAGGNQTEQDWRRLLSLDPQGSFAACFDGRMVGTASTIRYTPSFAFIGMLVVDRAYRRLGIARQLVQACLSYLEEEGVETVKLYTCPAGQRCYEEQGFVFEGYVERWEGEAPQMSGVTGGRRGDLESWDLRAYGVDRSRLLTRLAGESCAPPLCWEDRGYAMAREGALACQVGPVVAADEEAAVELLDGMLARLAGRQVFVDWNTNFPDGGRLLAARGFVKKCEMLRMRRGPEAICPSPLVVAIAGTELG